MENPANEKLVSSAMSSVSNFKISRFFEHNKTYGSFDVYLDSKKADPNSFDDCVGWARLNFERNFSVDLYPAAGQNARSRSSPIAFDVNDSHHLDYIVTASNLRAKSFGLPQLTSREEIAKLVIQLEDKIQEIKLHLEFSGEEVLPNEMWCCVFKNLNLADLKNVSLTCKRFHEIIADSMELMKKFEVELTDDVEMLNRVYANSIRKYQKVTCEDIILDVMYLNFFVKNPISWLQFRWTECSEETFKQILNAVTETIEFIGLAFIHLNEIDFSTETNIEFKPLEWKRLKTVELYEVDNCVLRYLPHTIEILSIESSVQSDKDLLAVQFANKQKKLKELRLEEWIQPELGFKKVEFEIKLDRLQLSSDEEIFNENMHIVLQNQFDCLRSLELWDSIEYQQLTTVINKMQKLEKLILSDIYFTSPENEIPTKMYCTTLKSFKIDSFKPTKRQRLKLVLEAFPNLEELEVTGPRVVAPKLIFKFIQKLKRLEMKQFSDFDFAGARLPNLLELIIHTDGKFSKVFKSCPNLIKVAVRSAISESTFRAILKNAKNLKCLIILDGSELPQNTIETNEYLLKNLEELRIYNFEQQTEASNTLLAKHLKLRSYVTSEDYSRESIKNVINVIEL